LSERDAAIQVRNLAKRYRLGEQDVLHGSLRDAFANVLTKTVHVARGGSRPKRDTLWALDHVTFDVERGQVLGIIGRNGAGKTTLLKILSRITEPTDGEARIRGRVGSLLEVGTGFHGDLTGRENIFLNGAILGMRRREIERKFDEIVSFAEVERFIDTPVKRYSSGMYLRLAFAVAAHLEPDILIVDEVLAVGDAAFQRKCLGKMGEVSGEGRTVLLVSHNMAAITQLAHQCLWLDRGRIRELGPSADVVASYLGSDVVSETPGFADVSADELRKGDPKKTDGDVRFEWVRLRDDEGRTSSVFFTGEPLSLELGIRSAISAGRLEILCSLRTLDGFHVFTLMTGVMEVELNPGRYEISVSLPWNPLRHGTYQLDLYMLTGPPQDLVRSAIQLEVAGLKEDTGNPRDSMPWGVVNVDQQWTDLRPAEATRVSSSLETSR
jgi:lipopolysaccharide transport system ATP-binding protein